ncbi:MAG TPA: transglutaminaseTgpA domain-containing protein [Acidimicrobiia bacterium]|nr:transglutaminaseTgpA domain-containing protein [Acidimicrobiia bacterium]
MSERREERTRTVAQPFRIVAFPAALALGSIGAIAAERVNLPPLLGFAGGALAAALSVLALPSVPTRRATIILLGVGGLGALRHASYSGVDRSVLLATWAIATLVALVMVDRAEAELVPSMRGGRPLAPGGYETARIAAIVGMIVVVAAVALVPTVTDRLGRHVWPGLSPTFGQELDAPASLRSNNSLDMTSRPRLSDKVVFTVDSPRRDFWRGETFDLWDGRTWTRSNDQARHYLQPTGPDHLEAPAAFGDAGAEIGDDLRQTFHIETTFSDVVFAAPSPRIVETDKSLFERPDGTIAIAGGTGNAFGKGAVYTVVSRRYPATADDLRAANASDTPPAIVAQYAQAPTATTSRVRALARQITAGSKTTYDSVQAIENWLGANTRYSLDAPLSPENVDVVDDFLFRSKLGWCEQIASSLVVLARSVGIPARLTTGFAPGERDGLTGRFVVRERDAHAWAEIYFPGIGWQGFDPTENVPLAGDAAAGGSWLDSLRRHAVVLLIVVSLLVLLATALPGWLAAYRRRRRVRPTWGSLALRRLERAGRKAGRPRAPAETPREYARALADHLENPSLVGVGAVIDQDAFSAEGAPDDVRSAADTVLLSL